MVWLAAGLLVVIGCFSGVLLFGAPYLPTLSPQVAAALELGELQPGDTMLELGCGDGKVLIAAARRGILVVGYELNPLLVIIAWLRTRRYRHNVRIIWGDFWRRDWPEAEVIFTFLLPKYMPKLHKKVMQYNYKPVKVVSFAFPIKQKSLHASQANVFRYDYS